MRSLLSLVALILFPTLVVAQATALGIANPAAVFCEAEGHSYSIVTAEDGSQMGLCELRDGQTVDAWAFFRDESAKRAADMVNPASEFCVASGGTYEITVDEAGNSIGICLMPGQPPMDAWEFYRSAR